MTYVAMAGPMRVAFGADCADCYDDYLGLWQDSEDVYVFRAHLSGIDPPITTAAQAMKLVAAFGQVHRQKDMDVTGVAIDDQGGGNVLADIIYVTSDTGPTGCYGFACLTEDNLATAMADKLKAEWPQATATAGQRRELVKPAEALDFWRASPILWSHELSSPGGFGGPTRAFGQQQNAWRGSAAARQAQLQPPVVPPIGPGPKPGPPPVGPDGPQPYGPCLQDAHCAKNYRCIDAICTPLPPSQRAGISRAQIGMMVMGVGLAYLMLRGRNKGRRKKGTRS